MMPNFNDWCKQWGEPEPDDIRRIAGDGSDRQYFRFQYTEGTRVFMWNPQPVAGVNELNDQDSFVRIAGWLSQPRKFAPQIYHVADRAMLLEDLGDRLLYHVISELQDERVIIKKYQRVLADLHAMVAQVTPRFDESQVHNEAYTGAFMRRWEGAYFVERFLSLFPKLEYDAAALDRELDWLARQAEDSGDQVFLYRDFQSRNILCTDGGLRYIDFQGGRLGPSTYDPASLIIDPYVNLGPEIQEQLVEYYLGLLQPDDVDRWRENYRYVSLFRNLQALGAYGFLSRVKGKPEFHNYFRPGVEQLQHQLKYTLFSHTPVLVHTAEQLLQVVQ